MIRRSETGRWRGSLAVAVFGAVVVGTACSPGSQPVSPEVPTPTAFNGFDGCFSGASSVVVFLQRTLDEIGSVPTAPPPELSEEFDEGIHALLLRAREVHCTEEGFNAAVIARVEELEARGPFGDSLIAAVRARGLGSLSVNRGGPLRLPDG